MALSYRHQQTTRPRHSHPRRSKPCPRTAPSPCCTKIFSAILPVLFIPAKQIGSVTMRNDPQHDKHQTNTTNGERIEPQLSSTDADDSTFLESPITAASASVIPTTGKKALGALSALTLALLCSSAAFAWWSMQRMELLEQQLIATQDSFSKISEDAAGRLSEISGQFTATESSVQSDIQTLTQRLNSLESSSVEVHKQQQISLTEQGAQLSQIDTE